MPHAQITLEQWRALIAVVESGGYSQAAEKLYKSQSAVTYAVQKIETLLELKAFEIEGRKAVLTTTGQMLYRRALALLEEANDLEQAAHNTSAGWEAKIGIAAEILFPSDLLLKCLAKFGDESPRTRIELVESVLGGTSEALINKEVDIAISPNLPSGYLGELIMRIKLVAVAHVDHPLNNQEQEIISRDLRSYRHLVIRDSGAKRESSSAILDVEQRWTVSHVKTSIQAVCMGYGFAWLPESHIQKELSDGLLKPIPLKEGGIREIPLYLMIANPEIAGSGVKRLVEIIKEATIQSQDRKNF